MNFLDQGEGFEEDGFGGGELSDDWDDGAHELRQEFVRVLGDGGEEVDEAEGEGDTLLVFQGFQVGEYLQTVLDGEEGFKFL